MATRLAEGVWWFDLGGVNAYLVEDDGGVTLLDAGMPWQSDRLAREIRTVTDSVADIDRVLVTHFDFDHIGTLGRLDLDATVYVGSEDEPYLTGQERPAWTNTKGAFQRVTSVFRDAVSLPVEGISDGDTVGGFSAVHTPGHTPGHTVFVHEEHSVAVLGDLVRERDGGFELPPHLLNANHDQARESVVSLSSQTAEFEMGCPGHGRPVGSDASGVLKRYADALAES